MLHRAELLTKTQISCLGALKNLVVLSKNQITSVTRKRQGLAAVTEPPTSTFPEQRDLAIVTHVWSHSEQIIEMSDHRKNLPKHLGSLQYKTRP